MNQLDKQYQGLLIDLLENGIKKEDRTGTGTLSVFGRQIRHKMSEGFPLLTTKKMFWKGIVTELLWFLRGDSDIRFLWENNCFIWDGDWYKKYKTTCSEPYTLEEVKQMVKDGNHKFHDSMFELGPVYGKQWRSWDSYDFVDDETHTNKIDQIQNLIRDLKTNPDSRRLMVSAWNVGELDQMVLPPCHYGFQVYTRELSEQEVDDLKLKIILDYLKDNGKFSVTFEELKADENLIPNIDWRREIWGQINYYDYGIGGQNNLKEIYPILENIPTRAISLMWNQRSVDTFLGLPFNIASYGLLLEIIAKTVNMVPDELIGNLGDTHLYLNHVEQAKEQIGRELSLDERTKLLSDRVGCEIKETILHGEGQFETEVTQDANAFNIPKRTREPYPLPTLTFMKTDEFFKSLGDDLSLITHLDTSDFVIDNYQSHPTIKAPLSN